MTSAVSQSRPRMIVPDVARGMALLGIALANVCTGWITTTHPDGQYFGGIDSGNVWDKATVLFTAMFAHNRGLPMFSTLLGFGIGLITLSLWRRGFPLGQARMVIIKRYGFLALFGIIHLVFIFNGDIMFFYGCCALVISMFITLHDKTLKKIAYTLLTIITVLGIGAFVFTLLVPELGMNYVIFSELPKSYGKLVLDGLVMLLGQAVAAVPFMLMYGPIMLVGFTWARQGTLADVASHRTELRIWAGIAAAIILGVGLPWGLAAIGVLPAEVEGAFYLLNTFVGVITGPGILAMLALVLEKVQTLPWWLWPFSALGKRSMSGYIMQSIIFFAVVFPFTLNIGSQFYASGLALLAVGNWLLTLLLACLLEYFGKPGPFEWLHRRISYGKTMRPELKKQLPSGIESPVSGAPVHQPEGNGQARG